MIRRLGALLPWALLLLFALRGLAAMRVDGATADEPLHLAYGERALHSGTFLREDDRLNSKMPVSVLNALPVAIARHAAAPRELPWPRVLFLARLPSLLLGLLLGVLVWRWTRDLFGARAGALALLLYTFCPNVLAHSHLVTTDIGTTLAMFAATWAFWRYTARPTRGRLLVAAAAFGLAQLTKVTALFLAPIFVLILLVRLVRLARLGPAGSWRRQAARDLGVLLALAAGLLVALNAGFLGEGTLTPLKDYGARGYAFVSPTFQALAATPGVRAVPLPLPFAYVQGLDMTSRDSRVAGWTYLRGRYSETGFRSYFFWAFLVKVPIATQLLLLLTVGLRASGRLRAPGAEEFLIVPALFLAAYFSLLFRLDIGLRYILPIFPFLFVFAGRAAAAFSLPALTSRARLGTAAVSALVVWLGISSAAIHPHYLAYFNEIAGGPDQGWRWLIDSNLDWGQDEAYAREVYAARSPVQVLFDPGSPVAGRVAIGESKLVGLDPAGHARTAWLRDHFRPIAVIGHSWKVFDVTPEALERCCAGLPQTWLVDDLKADLAPTGQPFGGGDGVRVRFERRINDGMLGANSTVDPARTLPPQPHPVRAWFGVNWQTPQTIGRVVAYPGFDSRGPRTRRFLALDYVFQAWDGAAWRDLPGTRVTSNPKLRLEHRFPAVRTTGLRLVVERERNEQGEESSVGAFRAACLELAAYPQ
jgi:4-amino-4-deoxy-L-arabinose transferase-like glycosyltransferase